MTPKLTAQFDRWMKTLPPGTVTFIRAVLDRVVPIYEAAGLAQYDDYAGGDLSMVGANTVPLQRRDGARWATVELKLDRQGHRRFGVYFAELDDPCVRWTSGRAVTIDRKSANVTEGKASFILCKGTKRAFDCTFGVAGFSLRPSRSIDLDLAAAVSQSQKLVALLAAGLPQDWMSAPAGYVNDYVFKKPSLIPPAL